MWTLGPSNDNGHGRTIRAIRKHVRRQRLPQTCKYTNRIISHSNDHMTSFIEPLLRVYPMATMIKLSMQPLVAHVFVNRRIITHFSHSCWHPEYRYTDNYATALWLLYLVVTVAFIFHVTFIIDLWTLLLSDAKSTVERSVKNTRPIQLHILRR